MDRGGLIIGAGAQLGEPIVEAPHTAAPTQFDAFLADIRAKTRHDIQQAKRELLDGLHEFSASAISAHCDSMATMARAVEHSADAAAAAFERSFAEYHAELASRDATIDSLRTALVLMQNELVVVRTTPVLPRWWAEFKRALCFWRSKP